MSARENGELVGDVEDALRLVIDPELGHNIVDLGLVYDIAVTSGGIARIAMTTTMRGCPAADYLKAGAREAASAVPGIERAEVALTWDPPWTPHMMSAHARRLFCIGDDGEP